MSHPFHWNSHIVLLMLLVSSAAINYLDRSLLSIAAPMISSELLLTPSQMGVLHSAFFWGYVCFMMPAGWLADRFSPKWVLAIGFVFWSGATLATGFATSFAPLLALRFLLGLGESVSIPSYSKAIASNFPAERRGFPNALIDVGLRVGPGLGSLFGGPFVGTLGWRPLFVLLGCLAPLWLIPWLWFARVEKPTPRSRSGRRAASMLQIVRRREAWGTFLGNFCANWAFFFLLTWTPSYLVKERHLSMASMGLLGSLPFWAGAFSCFVAGWLSDRLIAKGGSVTRVRKSFVISGLLTSSLIMPAAAVSSVEVSITLLVAAAFGYGFFSSNHWAISQTLAGPESAGRWAGLQNSIGQLAGILAPIIAGLIVSWTGTLYMAFVCAGIFVVLGAVSYGFLIREVAPIQWPEGAIALTPIAPRL